MTVPLGGTCFFFYAALCSIERLTCIARGIVYVQRLGFGKSPLSLSLRVLAALVVAPLFKLHAEHPTSYAGYGTLCPTTLRY